MNDMELVILILINVAAIFVFFLLFGLPANRYKKRMFEALERMKDTSVDKNIFTNFSEVSSRSLSKARVLYLAWAAAIGIGLYIAFQVYATATEPNAHIGTWVLMYGVFYGVGFIGAIIILASAVSRYYQAAAVNKFIDTEIAIHPNSPVLADVKEMVRFRYSEVGVSTLSFVAVVGCILVGAGYLVVLYLSAQTAIECARSSKCI